MPTPNKTTKKKLTRPKAPSAPAKKKKGKQGRKPVAQAKRQLPATVPAAAKEIARHVAALRNIAATDYITDPDGHTVEWHWQRSDRPFKTSVSLAAFTKWSVEDKWNSRRKTYWKGIEERVQEHMADEFIRRRIRDLQQLEEQFDGLSVYLKPLVDEHGNTLINEKTGLPVYPLDLPKMDRFIESYLKLHERIMLLRGEATKRTELTSNGEAGEQPEEESEAGKSLRPNQPRMRPQLSKQEARSLARQLVKSRTPELAEVIDAGGSYVTQEIQSGEAIEDPERDD